MGTISLQQAIGYAKAAGFSGTALEDIVAIAMAESGLNTDAVNPSSGATGVLQIYLAVHPDVARSQALDPAFSFRYSYRLSNGGTNFCPWQSYNCGKGYDNRYAQYLPQVRAALGVSSNTAVSLAINTAKTTGNALSLASNASIATALSTLDELLTLSNPFDITAQQDEIANIAPLPGTLSFTDPVDWLSKLGNNLVADLIALVLRAILLMLGLFLLFKVINHFVDFTGIAKSAVNNASSLAQSLGPLLAA